MDKVTSAAPTCADCPTQLDRGTRKKRCRPCAVGRRKAAAREATAAWRSRQPKAELPEFPCGDCGAIMKRLPGKGRAGKRYCDDCLVVRVRDNTNRYKRGKRAEAKAARPPRTCLNCPTDMTWEHGKKLRCTACVRATARQTQHKRRAWKNGVEADSFLSVEIYERDGWRCGLCRKKIRKELQYPHPLSASLDHIIPFAHGGSHARSNSQAAHLRCNLIKSDKIKNVQMMLFG